jgi:phosphoglycolate phosphatase-like HAD superfamily hydrolase
LTSPAPKTEEPHTMSAIYFDLDGTLTDPKPGITGSIQYALQKLDLPVPSQDELRGVSDHRFAAAL